MTLNKGIIVKESNKERIQKLLDEIQNGCRAHLLDFALLTGKLKHTTERKIAISKKDLEGSTITIATDCGAYRGKSNRNYSLYVTKATCVYHSGNWTLVALDRCIAEAYDTYVNYSDSAKAAIIAKYEKF